MASGVFALFKCAVVESLGDQLCSENSSPTCKLPVRLRKQL
jgi:hypothetical protein